MEINTMSIEELQERKAAIAAEVDALEDLEEVQARSVELDAINAELEARKTLAEKKAEIRASVAAGAGVVTEKIEDEKENKTMTIEEVRAMPSYVDAFAKYIRSGDDRECRAILTETNPGSVVGSGPVPVPVIVDQIVRTAWDNDELLNRVRKTYFRGNLKVAFERSATAAALHTEGTTGPSEESLVLGIVTMIPKNIKKWIKITDEAAAMGGEAFIRYIYDELTYQIIKKLANEIGSAIKGASASHGPTAVGIPQVTAAPALGTVATAMGNLSDEAVNPVVLMNRLTWSAFKTAQYAAYYAADPFEGLPVVFCDAFPAYATADDNAVYMAVGDLGGVTVNYPEGDGVVIKWDDLTEAEDDLIKVVGRQYVAYAVTAPGRFCNVKKPAAAT